MKLVIMDNKVDSNVAEKLDNMVSKWKHKKNEPLYKVKCDCGNTIRIFNPKKEVLCFRCNHKHYLEGNTWVKGLHKDTLTIGDLNKQKKGNKQVLTIG